MSKQIRLDDSVYERIKSAKRDDESFSNTVERLLADSSFSDLRDVFDEEQVSEMRAAIEAADEQDRQAVTETAERFK